MKKVKIAFVCVHNSCRSQIAEALAKLFHPDFFEAYSGGTETKPKINHDALRLMKALYGVDMDKTQFSKLITQLPPIDVVITMGCNVECPYIPSKFREDWGLDDPTGHPDEFFIDIINTIQSNLENLRTRMEQKQIKI